MTFTAIDRVTRPPIYVVLVLGRNATIDSAEGMTTPAIALVPHIVHVLKQTTSGTVGLDVALGWPIACQKLFLYNHLVHSQSQLKQSK